MALTDLKIEQLKRYKPLRRCVVVLLRSMGWNGDPAFLHEYFEKQVSENQTTILNGLSHMNYKAQVMKTRLSKIDSRLLPCMFITNSNDPLVILEKSKEEKDSYKVYVGKLDTIVEMPLYPTMGSAILAKPSSDLETTLHEPQVSWFYRVFMRFQRHIAYALLVSFMLSLLSLAMPFFVNLIFKKISTEQITTDFRILFYGIVLYLIASFLLTLIRSRVQTVISSRLGFIVINEVIRRILFLPSPYTETAPINTQLARVKDFESVKEFFAGAALTSILDMPFVIILIGGLAWIDSVMAVIPLVSILAFTIMAFSIKRLVRTTNLDAAQATKDMQDFVLDTLGNLKAIRNLGYTEKWLQRFRELSSRSIHASRKSSDVTALIINLAQGISSLAGLATMTVGVFRIFEGVLQPTSLMAAMLLTWRILAPMKTGFSVFSQVDRLRRSIEQIDRLMTLNIEKSDFTSRKSLTKLEGHVVVSQVSLRYGRESNATLLGVSFDAKPGETVVVLGNGGSGKSTLLKLIMAMYPPQTGHVLIDGKNTRQLDPIALRKSIAYMPASVNLLSGTLREHIKLVNPHASKKLIEEAIVTTGLEEEIRKLRRGLNTRLDAQNQHLFPPSFLRRFSLALMFVKQSGLWIIDNPGLDLEVEHEKQIMSSLAEAKGKATIIVATHNPEYASIADRVLVLNNGRTVAFAAPTELDESKPPI